MHPLFVHFPIALLVIYALMELTPKFLSKRSSWWQGTKVFLLALGVLAIFPTIITGDIDSQQPIRQAVHDLVEKHEMFAGLTLSFFSVLLAAYVVGLITGYKRLDRYLSRFKLLGLWRLLRRLSDLILTRPVCIALALGGLIALTITGGLGASIGHGPDVDPIVRFIYNLVV